MRTTQPSALIPFCLGTAVLLFTGCATVTGDYRIPDGAIWPRSYTSVAGDITVGRRANIRNARTVAGDITIGEGSRVGNLRTVAGEIHLATGVRVEGWIRTVVGDVRVARDCVINGDVSTEDGHITLTRSVVAGDVSVIGGQVDLIGSRITGVLRVKAPDDDDDDDRAIIDIGPDSEVTEIVVERKALARLRIHRSAQVGSVQGIVAEYYAR
jgi:acyl-[acyl carrier protein]--UDP-N-acetylglucosamine O-acyltransferase